MTEEDVIDDTGENAGDSETDPNTIFVDMTSASKPEPEGEEDEGKNVWGTSFGSGGKALMFHSLESYFGAVFLNLLDSQHLL